MATSETIAIFADVSVKTWTKLSVLAMKLGINKREVYNQALTWAIGQKAFRDTMAKVYAKPKDR